MVCLNDEEECVSPAQALPLHCLVASIVNSKSIACAIFSSVRFDEHEVKHHVFSVLILAIDSDSLSRVSLFFYLDVSSQ